ncbi:uncharacterized membrane protein HdeD (DUF308 family) [Leucobacter exalbidus]|uniref:Uncharacterized membrane protein HdeD (DUF308 family) n=1 Tax=Leucobacter exalbidus TaxID=662960 RepID=A0A940PMM7_9MICO|nr:DUF308 domain-containing protein [Leucobacter exalbidus]MBP1325900.1 uncharacterized membrane protein HdeD (DUF308 family) [Leucobacter exalbidus]
MTIPQTAPLRAVTGIRTALAVGGVIALIVGILILALPGKSAMVVAVIVGLYAIIAGIVYACLGVFSKARGGWSRVGHILLGLIFVIAGVVAFANLAQTTAWLAIFVGVLVGVMWLMEGIVALSTLADAGSKIWSIIFALISIFAGLWLIFSPLAGVVVLWWLLGITLAVLGIMNIVRAITFGAKLRQGA